MSITTGNEGGDAVNHPPHYNQHPSGIEAIEVVRHFGFDVGNAIKYLWRAGLKTDLTEDELAAELRDTEKAIWYLKDHAEELRRRQLPPIVSMPIHPAEENLTAVMHHIAPEGGYANEPHPFRPGHGLGLFCSVCSEMRHNAIHKISSPVDDGTPSPGPICCDGKDCCGPGSYCCGHPERTGDHDHDDD